MTPYVSKSGKESGIEAYQLGDDFIRVKFKHRSKPYKYSYRSAGKMAVEAMRSLAIDQKGLSTYIAKNNPEFE
jgi:hypothetical protein